MGALAKYTYYVIRFITPYVWRAIQMAARLVMVTLGALFSGIPTSTDRIAYFVTAQAMGAGILQEYDRQLYWASRIAAFLVILAGWLLTAYLTVWTLGLIF